MQKALAGGIPLVAAISAPTSLAIEFAKQSSQTLVAFLRPPRFRVYAGDGRLG
jgi:FdhD protein